jgi:hypothetical protein
MTLIKARIKGFQLFNDSGDIEFLDGTNLIIYWPGIRSCGVGSDCQVGVALRTSWVAFRRKRGLNCGARAGVR